MKVIIAVVLVVVCLVVKIVYDYRLFLKRIPVNHKKERNILAIASIPALVLFTLGSTLPWYFAGPLSLAMICFFTWLFFDGIYNVARGFGFFFTGSDDPDDPASDNFIQAIPPWLHIVIKVGGLAGTVIVYILNLKP